jgi:hypothetical protein
MLYTHVNIWIRNDTYIHGCMHTDTITYIDTYIQHSNIHRYMHPHKHRQAATVPIHVRVYR